VGVFRGGEKVRESGRERLCSDCGGLEVIKIQVGNSPKAFTPPPGRAEHLSTERGKKPQTQVLEQNTEGETPQIRGLNDVGIPEIQTGAYSRSVPEHHWEVGRNPMTDWGGLISMGNEINYWRGGEKEGIVSSL